MRLRIPARLHMGVLDVSRDVSRRYSGIGCAIKEPRIILDIDKSDRLEARGLRAELARQIARKCLDSFGVNGGVSINILEDLPQHVGLGSGTQLAMGVSYGIAKLYKIDVDTDQLFLLVGRGEFSSIGLHTFKKGGFVFEGGRQDRFAPLIRRYDVPDEWRFLVVVPKKGQGLHGDKERRAFASLDGSDAQIFEIVEDQLLPGLRKSDIEKFGEALNEVQDRVGRLFAGAQGGVFNKDCRKGVEILRAHGLYGGQSSWGPTFYGISDDEKNVIAAKREIEKKMDLRAIYVTEANNKGAGIIKN